MTGQELYELEVKCMGTHWSSPTWQNLQQHFQVGYDELAVILEGRLKPAVTLDDVAALLQKVLEINS